MRLLFWKKNEQKQKELEEQIRNITEQLEKLKNENEKLKEKVEEELKMISILRESNIKLSEALIKLARVVEQKSKTEDIYIKEDTKEEKNLPRNSDYIVLEEEIIKILREKKQPVQAREISQITRKTREHVSRTLKSMTDKGIVKREKKGKVFLYSLKTDL